MLIMALLQIGKISDLYREIEHLEKLCNDRTEFLNLLSKKYLEETRENLKDAKATSEKPK